MTTTSNDPHEILALNCGSTSVRFAFYRLCGSSEQRIYHGLLEQIGTPQAAFHALNEDDEKLTSGSETLDDHEAALARLFAWLGDHSPKPRIEAVGHRIVHGGTAHHQPTPVTEQLIESLRRLVPLAVEHLPHGIKGIEAILHRFPEIPQVACFDTAFHRTMPEIARYYALPRRFRDNGIQRYGFHGLSCEYIVQELQRCDALATGRERLIIAHLGGGSSMTAVRDGQSIETTMGMTPLAGLVMSRRCGDIDPGVLIHLLREKHMTVEELDRILNQQSGLLGISGHSADMRTLRARENEDPRAAEAIALYCHQARKYVGALTASLGGLDKLIFTAGIGENSCVVRARICDGLEHLGIRIDPEANAIHAQVISAADSNVEVRVMKTNEELMIARQTMGVITEKTDRGAPAT